MRRAVPVFAVLAAAGIAYSIYQIFFDTPLQFGVNDDGRLNGSSLFFNQKIFYLHTAHAMLMIVAVVVAGLASIGFLVRHKPVYDDVARAAVETAVVFGVAMLISGSIWAKAAWDVWWQWEARLTLSLLLWLILVGYAIVRKFAGPSADRIAAGMAIFGSVGTYFLYTMVGQDSHPASGGEGVVATLGPGMRGTFWLAVVSVLCWFIALVLSRIESVRAERELREIRERGLDLGVLQ
jgi:heme exporter protein C